jgi:hypothetical protein
VKKNCVWVIECRRRGTKRKFQPTDLVVFNKKDAQNMADEIQDLEYEFKPVKYVSQNTP